MSINGLHHYFSLLIPCESSHVVSSTRISFSKSLGSLTSGGGAAQVPVRKCLFAVCLKARQVNDSADKKFFG